MDCGSITSFSMSYGRMAYSHKRIKIMNKMKTNNENFCVTFEIRDSPRVVKTII